MNTADVFASRGGFASFVAPVSDGYRADDSWAYKLSKRLVDLAAAAVGLALLMPLFPFIVLLIKIETPGPILPM